MLATGSAGVVNYSGDCSRENRLLLSVKAKKDAEAVHQSFEWVTQLLQGNAAHDYR